MLYTPFNAESVRCVFIGAKSTEKSTVKNLDSMARKHCRIFSKDLEIKFQFVQFVLWRNIDQSFYALYSSRNG